MPKQKTYDRIFSQLYDTPWLITENWLLQIENIANRQGDLELVEKRLSDPLIGTEKATVRDGVAIIPISGPIFPKANLMTAISGATSISQSALDLTTAIEDPEVTDIVLKVDSPGGHVTGMNEFANMIREYNTIKPIHGYSGGTAASGGYWLLSACKDVTIDATARLGSIGVVAGFRSKSDDDPTEIVNTASPNKRVDHTTKEGRAVVVEELDTLAEVFISSVAKFRGVSDSTVKSDFGKGGILVGADAVKVGMADKLGSFEGLLEDIKKKKGGMDMPQGTTANAITASSIKEQHPEVYESIFNAGASAAVEESDAIIATKNDEISKIKEDHEMVVNENKELKEKNASFEKKEAIQRENAIKSESESIVGERLSASTVPERLHSKVKAIISCDAFVVDGKLDSESFKAYVEEEVSSWETEESSVSGVGTSTGVETSKVSPKKVDDMVAHLASLAQ